MVTAATVASKRREALSRRVAPVEDHREALAGLRASLVRSPLVRTVEPGTVPEGRTARLRVTAGTVELAFFDPARRARAEETALAGRRARVSDLARRLDEGQDLPPATRGTVVEWSGKSRSNMLRSIAALDLRPLAGGDGWVLGMVTLTLPGDWLTVAPNGREFKRMVRAFCKRFGRAYGKKLVGIWKLEFQRRGAPHLHIAMPVPTLDPAGLRPFESWLSETWAEVVGHPDPVEYGKHLRAGTAVDFSKSPWMGTAVDVARYFLKHSAKTSDDKEYQHVVPEAWAAPGDGPGRFWGYWGLEPVAEVVECDPVAALRVKRVLRRWDRANAAHYGRRRRRSLGQSSMTGAWVLVDDPPAFARLVAESAGLIAPAWSRRRPDLP